MNSPPAATDDGPTLIVAPEEAGLRLDAFLVRRQLVSSAGAARRWLDRQPVRIDGRRGDKGARLRAGQVVNPGRVPVVEQGGSEMSVVPDASLELETLYVDDLLVAVAKPAGMPVHPLRANERGSVAAALVARFPECARASEDPREGGLVHRLDPGTSGVLLAARDPETWKALRRLLAGPNSEKTYVAEVVGVPQVRVVDVPIGHPGRRSANVRLGTGRGLLPARTEIALLQQRGETSLVEAKLQQGRRHQVRVHLAHAGAPVLGDAVYGDEAAMALARERNVVGFRLHALRIRLPHPKTDAPLEIEAPLPPWAR